MTTYPRPTSRSAIGGALAFCGALTAFAPIGAAAQTAIATPVPGMRATPCVAGQLAASADREDGAFDGMSHTGVRLTVRNTSATTCALPRTGDLAVLGAGGATLPIVVKNPPVVGMHPGPVLVPIALAPGASASLSMLWIDAKVMDDGVCIATSAVDLRLGDGAVAAPLRATMCGPAGAVTFRTTHFTSDAAASPRRPT